MKYFFGYLFSFLRTFVVTFFEKLRFFNYKFLVLCLNHNLGNTNQKGSKAASQEGDFALWGGLAAALLFVEKSKANKNLWLWVFTISYLVFLLILPIFSLLFTASQTFWPFGNDEFWKKATDPVAISAYSVTLNMALCASLFNTFFGFLLAWILTRYNFLGKKLVDAAIDLPFALPTSVAGLTLATVYSDQGWIGATLSKFGIHIVFTRLGVLVAMIFVSFPFVVRTLQPVLQELEKELEEAAWSLGASPVQTFLQVIFPNILPSLLTGLTLGFSRAIGEFGSIVIIASNIPLKDLIASVLIFQSLEQYDYAGATIIGTVVLLLSLILLLGVNLFQSWRLRR